MVRRARNHSVQRYPRTARLNELCREILADELERIDDERLTLVTIIHVTVDPDLRHAKVEVSALGQDEEEALGESLAALMQLCDEVVVYDTGSTDRTVEIARAAALKGDGGAVEGRDVLGHGRVLVG